jgi:hypothetical protein
MKGLMEIVARLPLSLLTANERLQVDEKKPANIQDVYECCSTNCNVVHSVLYRYFDRLRPTHLFHSCWLRFLSILASNCHMLMRGTMIHEYMLEMLASSFKLIVSRLSTSEFDCVKEESASIIHSSESANTSEPSTVRSPATSWIAWWSGSKLESTPVVQKDPTPVVQKDPTPEVQKDPRETEKVPDPSHEQERLGKSERFAISPSNHEIGDLELLLISWRTVSSLYPSAQAHLLIKDSLSTNALLHLFEKHGGKVDLTFPVTIDDTSTRVA